MSETKEAVAKPHPPPTHEKKGWSLGAIGVQGPLIGLVLLCVVFSISTDVFLTWRNWLNIIDQITVLGITVFFGRADALALGAAQAVKVANLGHKVIVVGFDGDVAGLKAVESGTLDATMTQKTQGMGKLALESALDLAAGKQVPKEQLQEAVLTTKENVKPFIENHP